MRLQRAPFDGLAVYHLQHAELPRAAEPHPSALAARQQTGEARSGPGSAGNPSEGGLMSTSLDLLVSFSKVGTVAWGGGPAMVPLMEAEFVQHREWMSQSDFSSRHFMLLKIRMRCELFSRPLKLMER